MSGEIWKFSDKIDDADLAFLHKDFITCLEGQEYYGIGEKRLMRMAREAGAVYKIGRRFVRINRKQFEAYLRNIRAKEVVDASGKRGQRRNIL